MRGPIERVRAAMRDLTKGDSPPMCVRCRKTIVHTVPVYDVDPRTGKRVGPLHQACTGSFRDRIEVK